MALDQRASCGYVEELTNDPLPLPDALMPAQNQLFVGNKNREIAARGIKSLRAT